jgi:beta-glucosidase
MSLRLIVTAGVVWLGGAALAIAAAELPQPAKVFVDLNQNGQLDPYEDRGLAAEARAKDLLARMSPSEKAGLLLHGTAPTIRNSAGVEDRYDIVKAEQLIRDGHVTSMITRLAARPEAIAAENNRLQAIARRTRLGIPITISSDPRHHFYSFAGMSSSTNGFSQWPETLGFAALRDPALVRRFADIARQEYRATGIHMALSPQADIATEPRWHRIPGTFGEDPDIAGRLVGAYVSGFQSSATGIGPNGVAAIVKHWTGYGAARDGYDSHNSYGRFSDIRADALSLHIKPFLPAFAAGAAGVMPTYSILAELHTPGHPPATAGAGYDRWLLTDLLRGQYRFGGIILSDWGITNPCNETCQKGFPEGVRPNWEGISTAWGVEALTTPERFAMAINAGVDQIGGSEDLPALLEAERRGLVSKARIDESALRMLTLKFRLGLFDEPMVDPARAARLVGNAAFLARGRSAQARSVVLLKNEAGLLPTRPCPVWLRGIDPAAARAHGFTPVDDISKACVALIRAETPFQRLHPNFPFGQMMHEGDLDFKEGDATLEAIRMASQHVPTIVDIAMDRPAILTNVAPLAKAVIVNFGQSDDALFEVLTGKEHPAGKLPFELPRSMEAVRAQRSDLPADSEDPLYPIGFGLSYRP